MADADINELTTQMQTLNTENPSVFELNFLLPSTTRSASLLGHANRLLSSGVFKETNQQEAQNGMKPYTWSGSYRLSFKDAAKLLLASSNPQPLDFWLSHTTYNATTEFNQSLHESKFRFEVSVCSFGAFDDPFTFTEHAKLDQGTLGAASVSFDFNSNILNINFGHVYKLDIFFDHLKKLFIVQPGVSAETLKYTIFIYFTSVPRLWKLVQRILNFPGVEYGVLGQCSVLRITFRNPDESDLIAVIDKLVASQFKVWWAAMKIVRAPEPLAAWSDMDNVPWSIRWLVSEGFRVTDQLLRNEDVQLLYKHEDKIYMALQGLLSREIIVDVVREFRLAIHKMTLSLSYTLLPDLPNYTLIPKIVVTPTRLIFLPPSPVQMNRVLRQYGANNFITVSFRDEDSFHLAGSSAKQSENLIIRIKSFLAKGLKAGGRTYKFLGCSNSQLRHHGCWMYAKDPQSDATVENIRRWVGDLASIRCVATYVARMGQSFSSSTKTVDLAADEYTIEEEPDVMRDGYCFTDGVGKISEDMALKVAKLYGLEEGCSAFQIRLGGCKGVLTMDPTLPKGHVHIRPSMRKFTSQHQHLEVMDYSRPHMLYMNRQVILLLSQRGISDDVFFRLQEAALHKLTDMFVSNEEAFQVLSRLSVDIDIQKVYDTGVDMISDPFFRSILLEQYEEELRTLLYKTRIPIPPDKGRLMLGVADETCQLQYGEVFIQYSDNTKDPSKCTLVLGLVMIAKNPCFHPGDLRVFKAVDYEGLHHLVDCLVFPVNGKRPHPNEMSGSDLDGDLYWVTWHPDLIIEKNDIPMLFTKAESKQLNLEPNQQDIIEYIGEYIKNDRLGTIANAHLAHADTERCGIYSRKCIELAELHSKAVDFPKTGEFPVMDPDLKTKKYPDFMMKQGEVKYVSTKILGKLYRSLSQLWQSLGLNKKILWKHTNDQLEILFDGQLLHHPYYEKAKNYYSDYARTVQYLLDTYGLQNESSLLVGSVNKIRQNIMTKGELYECAIIMKSEVKKLRRKYLDILRKQDLETEMDTKALLWYKVAYENGTFKSFAWVAWSELMKLIQKLNAEISPQDNCINLVYPEVGDSNFMIQRLAVQLFLNAIREAETGLRCSLEHIDLTKWNIQSNDVYIKLKGVDAHLVNEEFAKLCSVIPSLNLNHQTLHFGSTGCYITKRGIEQTVMVNERVVTLHIYHSGVYDNMLTRATSLISESSFFSSCFQFFANFWMISGRQSLHDIITVLHLADMIMHFMNNDLSSVSNTICACFRWCTVFSNLEYVNTNSPQLWSLSSDVLRLLQLNLMEGLQLSSLSGACDILDSKEIGGEILMRKIIPMSENVSGFLSEMKSIVSNVLTTRSGCSIKIKEVESHRKCFHVVEGFGSERQLKKLIDEIEHFEFILSGLQTKLKGPTALNDIIYIFEGVGSDTGLLDIVPYRGPSYLNLKRKPIYIVGSRTNQESGCRQSTLLMPQQFNEWQDILQTVMHHCDSQYHGDFRIMCRFSCFHFFSRSTQTVSNQLPRCVFQKLLNERKLTTSCFSYDVNPTMMNHYLINELGLEPKPTEYATICSLTADKDETVNVVYDDNFELKQLRHQPISLGCLQVIRKLPADGRGRKVDIRFQFETMRAITNRFADQYADFLDAKKMFHMESYQDSKMPYLSVCKQYRDRVKFIRQKKVQSYTYPVGRRLEVCDHFTINVKVDINTVREYCFFDKRTGHAKDIKDYSDVTVVLPTVPPLHYVEDHRALMEKLLELNKKISNFIF